MEVIKEKRKISKGTFKHISRKLTDNAMAINFFPFLLEDFFISFTQYLRQIEQLF